MRNARSLRTLLSSLSLAGLVGASVSASLAAVQGPPPPASRGAPDAGPAASGSERPWGAGCRRQGQHLRDGLRSRVRSAGTPRARQPVWRQRGGRRTKHDDGRYGPVRVQWASRGTVQPVGVEAGSHRRFLWAASAGPAGHANPARRWPASPGPIADHQGWGDHGHRARRKRRSASRDARPRASLHHAERRADAGIRRERQPPTTAASIASMACSPASTSSSPRRETPTVKAWRAARSNCSSSCSNQR